jgi:hypothetical protein
MKPLNRKNHATLMSHNSADHNEYCVCRLIEDCALIKIESLTKLRAAKKYMRRAALDAPGSYVVFSNRSKRILGKVVSHAAA